MNEEHLISCPGCKAQLRAVEIAALLPDDVLAAENSRRNGRRQAPHPGLGRPKLARCPGCDSQMDHEALREHRLDCVRGRLESIKSKNIIRLYPKDLDPNPNFRIHQIEGDQVCFRKGSNDQDVHVDLRRIARIIEHGHDGSVEIRLLGRLIWDRTDQRWRFLPSLIGRPRGTRNPA